MTIGETDSIPHAFTTVARARPDALALIAGDRQVSYAALDRASDAVARRLLARGVAAEEIVAIAARGSVELITGILGILKAGCAYLPLDPSYPLDRLQFMLTDAGARIVLPGPDQRGQWQAFGVEEMPIAGDPAPPARGRARPAGRVRPDRLAYVIYTSGSTGRPKGIMVSHGAVLNHVRWRMAEFGLGHQERMLQRTPASFDIAVWEILGSLLTGCVLVLPEAAGLQDGACLVDAIIRHEITHLEIVPSILKLMLKDARWGSARSLHHVFAGGEALPVDVAAQCQAALGATLVNVYGPTETTIWSTFWICSPGATRVPIGHPILNTSAFVLDARARRVAQGEEGLLFLGGAGLARGYWRRPELTADLFVPDAHAGGGPGARLYNTGDLTRLDDDGALEFLGRRDGQVKLRGQRIELQEIEHTLKAHPRVADALVMIRHLRTAEPRIVAYVVLRDDEAGVAGNNARQTRLDEVEAFVARRLPDHMVPQHLRTIDEVPLLPNGKIHYKALPEPAYDLPPGTRSAPETDKERLLAAIWSDVLGVPEIRCDVRFSWYGGDSLQVVQMRWLAETRGLFVPPGSTYHYATVRELAAQTFWTTERRQTRQARARAAASLVRRAARVKLLEWRDRLRQQRTMRLEAPDRARFRAFYDRLPDTRDIYYLFVRRGLLHWVAKQMEFVPPTVNVVILGSALTAEEIAWIETNIRRPCFNTTVDIDDNAAWEFLFATNTRSFGWLEIGCFVLNSGLFRELARLEPQVAFNCVFTHTERHRRLFLEYMVFVNIDAIRAVQAHGIEVYPSRYSSYANPRPEHTDAYHRVPRGRDRDVVRRLLAAGSTQPAAARHGLLATDRLFAMYFYIGHLFYLHARELGFRLKRVRHLTEPSDVNGFHNFFSDEIIAALQVSRYEEIYVGQKFAQDYLMTLQADVALLRPMAARLPALYATRLIELEAKLRGRGIAPEEAGPNVREYLIGLSVSRQAFEAPVWRFLHETVPAPSAVLA